MIYHAAYSTSTFPFLRHLVVGGFSDEILGLSTSPTLSRLCFELVQNEEIVQLQTSANWILESKALGPAHLSSMSKIDISKLLSLSSAVNQQANFITLVQQLLDRQQIMKVGLDEQKFFMFFELLSSAERQCLLLEISDFIYTIKALPNRPHLAKVGARLLSALYKFLHYYAYKISFMKSANDLQAKHPNFVEELSLGMETWVSTLIHLVNNNFDGSTGFSVAALVGQWIFIDLSSTSIWVIQGLLPSVLLQVLHLLQQQLPPSSLPTPSSPSSLPTPPPFSSPPTPLPLEPPTIHNPSLFLGLLSVLIQHLFTKVPVEALVCHLRVLEELCKGLPSSLQEVCESRLANIKSHLT
eukprot:Phypoly_transcript_10346.p1 GENE.Phypoly_transcript_10346~~Phypoly_transcript_10346.p1  ORF type:complete len:355 (+),score=58.27 Phypoly_transcript_10346:240-1304(+)